MSVYVSAYVWEHSKHRGTELLLMLALADIASRDGFAYPSVTTLARYLRMSQRNTRRALRALEASGEVRVQMNGGPKGTHLFQIRMNETRPLFHPQGGEDKLSPPDKTRRKGRTPRSQTPDTAVSAEPSVTKYKPAAASERPASHPVDNSSAAADLIWPSKLPHGQQASIEHYLKANPSTQPQQLLDELQGVMREDDVRDPVAFFLHIAKQQAAGKFLPSHAHRIQVEREGEQAERELRRPTGAPQ